MKPLEDRLPSMQELETRLKALEGEIAEAERRLPAHSVKPAVMQMLLELEDEYDRLRDQLQRLKGANSRS